MSDPLWVIQGDLEDLWNAGGDLADAWALMPDPYNARETVPADAILGDDDQIILGDDDEQIESD